MDDYRSEYMAVPPLLVSAAGLETYLSMLSRQLQRDVASLRHDVAEARAQTSRACASMTGIKRYLGARAVRAMQAQATTTASTLADAGATAVAMTNTTTTVAAHNEDSRSRDDDDDDDEGDSEELEHALMAYSDDVAASVAATVDADAAAVDVTSANDTSSHSSRHDDRVDNRQLMLLLTLVRRLVRDNRALQRALEQSTRATRHFAEQQQRLLREVAQHDACVQRHRRDVRELARWFGAYDDALDAVVDLPCNGPDHDHVASSSDNNDKTSADDEGSMDALVSRAPLLLALRRVLVRDLGARITHAATTQTREVGAAVSRLRDDVAVAQTLTPERVAALVERSRHDEAAALVQSYGERLRAIEASYVRRDEYVRSMGTKADTLLLPVKADHATVAELEQRMRDRCTAFEERLAYFEAERDEMRRLVRALLQQQQRPRTVTPPRSGGDNNNNNNNSGNSSNDSNNNTMMTTATTATTLYRIVGVDRNAFATPRVPTALPLRPAHEQPVCASSPSHGGKGNTGATTCAAAAHERATPLRTPRRLTPTTRTATAAAAAAAGQRSVTTHTQREAVAWTAPQVPYARHVTAALNARTSGVDDDGVAGADNTHHATRDTLPVLSTTATSTQPH